MRMMIIAALAALSLGACSQTPTDRTLVQISAEGDVTATPDVAVLSTGVYTRGATAQQAMAGNATKMTAIIDAAKKAGVAEKDIQTSQLWLNPQFSYTANRPRVIGYEATNNVTVKVRDLKTIGAVIDAVVADGANNLSGISLQIDDPDAALDKARAEAVQKARARADAYAKAAGMSVRRLVSINESGGFAPPRRSGLAFSV